MGVGGGDPSVPGSERPQRLVGLLFTLLSAPPATSTSPLLYSLLSPPLFISPLPLPSLFHTPFCQNPPTPTPDPAPPFSYHHSCSTAPTLPSPLTVNNFAFVLFFLQSFFSLHKTFVRALHYLLRRERLGYRRSSVGQTKWFTEVRFLSYVSVHTPLLFKCGHWKCLALS